MRLNMIWKYALKLADTQTLLVPRSHKVLSVQLQGGILTMWIAVDPVSAVQIMLVCVVGTGRTTSLDMRTLNFVDTVQDGQRVWHVFTQEVANDEGEG